MKCIDIYIFQTGQHQLFPFTYMQKAYQLGIHGFVIQQGKDIFIEAEGEESNLEKFISYCRKSQFNIRKDYVEIEEVALKNYASFDILENNSELPTTIKNIEKKVG